MRVGKRLTLSPRELIELCELNKEFNQLLGDWWVAMDMDDPSIQKIHGPKLERWDKLHMRCNQILDRLAGEIPPPPIQLARAREFAARARIAKSIACKVRDEEEGE